MLTYRPIQLGMPPIILASRLVINLAGGQDHTKRGDMWTRARAQVVALTLAYIRMRPIILTISLRRNKYWGARVSRLLWPASEISGTPSHHLTLLGSLQTADAYRVRNYELLFVDSHLCR